MQWRSLMSWNSIGKQSVEVSSSSRESRSGAGFFISRHQRKIGSDARSVSGRDFGENAKNVEVGQAVLCSRNCRRSVQHDRYQDDLRVPFAASARVLSGVVASLP